MSINFRQCACKGCKEPRLFLKPAVNHLLHFILCIATVGIWAPMWRLLVVSNAIFEPYRCMTCGQADMFRTYVAIGFVIIAPPLIAMRMAHLKESPPKQEKPAALAMPP